MPHSPHTGSLPVTHSVLDPAGLMAEVQSVYDAGPIEGCTFLHLGLNDTYRVRTGTDQFILRVYHAGWRTRSDILYELDLLRHLDRSGILVSLPVAMRDGNLLHTVSAPEGDRYAALFTYAPGDVRLPDERMIERHGQLAATMHDAMDRFATPHTRFSLDQDHLLDVPMAKARPFVAHRAEDWAYLEAFADRLRTRLSTLVGDLDYGPCHGDFHWRNMHVAEDGSVTLFDFDCCGPGWRAYDLAIVRWVTERTNPKTAEANWQAFLRGYTERRSLEPADLAAVPLLVAMRDIWVLGLHAADMSGYFGSLSLLNDARLTERFAFLRDWETNHLIEVHAE